MPSTAVYFEALPLLIASIAACLMCSVVSKAGSPTPRALTSRPAGLSARAISVTAMVGDGLMRLSESARKAMGLSDRPLFGRQTPNRRYLVRQGPEHGNRPKSSVARAQMRVHRHRRNDRAAETTGFHKANRPAVPGDSQRFREALTNERRRTHLADVPTIAGSTCCGSIRSWTTAAASNPMAVTTTMPATTRAVGSQKRCSSEGEPGAFEL